MGGRGWDSLGVGDEEKSVAVVQHLGLESRRQVKLLRILGGREDSIPERGGEDEYDGLRMTTRRTHRFSSGALTCAPTPSVADVSAKDATQDECIFSSDPYASSSVNSSFPIS
jgi:hypothetical protein